MVALDCLGLCITPEKVIGWYLSLAFPNEDILHRTYPSSTCHVGGSNCVADLAIRAPQESRSGISTGALICHCPALVGLSAEPQVIRAHSHSMMTWNTIRPTYSISSPCRYRSSISVSVPEPNISRLRYLRLRTCYLLRTTTFPSTPQWRNSSDRSIC